MNSTIPGMPNGKPAGVRCVHLDEAYRCALFGCEDRPALCSQFQAEALVCGSDRQEAIRILTDWEVLTRNDARMDDGAMGRTEP